MPQGQRGRSGPCSSVWSSPNKSGLGRCRGRRNGGPEAVGATRTTVANGIVVTLNDADDVVVGGTVVFDGDRISYVGPAGGAPQPAGRVIDAAGQAVLPGLVDLHYHTAIGKGWSDHLPLWESLEFYWYPAIRALDDEDAYWAAWPATASRSSAASPR